VVIRDRGIPFYVRCLQVQDLGHPAVQPQDPCFNPFLPYDRRLHVVDLSSTHVGLLNKYSVVDHHMLVVTRAFVRQETPLELTDFHALRLCMEQIDGLGFYNSGAAAGASQRHRHLQLIPRTLAPGDPTIPVEPSALAAPESNRPTTTSQLPFAHALVRWAGPLPPAEALLATYHLLRDQLGIRGQDAYNLLLTRRWMLLVPRRAEVWESVSVNALGFGGALLVRNRAQLSRVRAVGPAAVLQAVSGRSIS
jgi:sulfate adenylyltransferase (ADP) / ATP adenylyltransferase